MIKFFETLGMVPAVTAGEGYAILKAKSGYLAVHNTLSSNFGLSGEAHLVLMVNRLEEFLKESESKCIDLQVWDEAWGRQAGIIDPSGGGIWINELEHDSYGYVFSESSQEPEDIEVVSVRYSRNFAEDRKFFETLGFVSAPGASSFWEQMSASVNSGWIGLHQIYGDKAPVRVEPGNPVGGSVPLVSLSFQTCIPGENFLKKLRSAGYPAFILRDEIGERVCTTTPDGIKLEVHVSSSAR
ncbi:hypothetical protein KRX54_00020 [Actinomycetaceae bacterium TAE3-ERU4]|nr:hypothetical protein [Actinomycetaceae bacterium TAE3-ERU4]